MASVSWKYPEVQRIALLRQDQEATDAAPVTAGVDISALNFRYAIPGNSSVWRRRRAVVAWAGLSRLERHQVERTGRALETSAARTTSPPALSGWRKSARRRRRRRIRCVTATTRFSCWPFLPGPAVGEESHFTPWEPSAPDQAAG